MTLLDCNTNIEFKQKVMGTELIGWLYALPSFPSVITSSDPAIHGETLFRKIS